MDSMFRLRHLVSRSEATVFAMQVFEQARPPFLLSHTDFVKALSASKIITLNDSFHRILSSEAHDYFGIVDKFFFSMNSRHTNPVFLQENSTAATDHQLCRRILPNQMIRGLGSFSVFG